MAITLRGAAPVSSFANNGNDVTVNLSGLSLQQGDVVLAFVSAPRVTGSTPAMVSSGWSPLFTAFAGSTTARPSMGGWYKVMGATPDGSVIMSGDTSSQTDTTGIAIGLVGVDSSVLDQITVITAETSSATPDPGAIVTQTNGAWVVVITHKSGATSSPTATPSGYSNTADQAGSDTQNHNQAIATKEVASAGSEDPGSWTYAASSYWRCVTVAVKPQAAATPLTPNPEDTNSANWQDGIGKVVKGLLAVVGDSHGAQWQDDVSIDLQSLGTTPLTATVGDNINNWSDGVLKTRMAIEYHWFDAVIVDKQDVGTTPLQVTVEDSIITWQDGVEGMRTLAANVEDILSFADGIQAQLNLNAVIGDGLSFTDGVKATLALNAEVGDDVNNFNDEVKGFVEHNAVVGDALALTDGVEKTLSGTAALEVVVGDTLSFTDGVAKSLYSITKHWNDAAKALLALNATVGDDVNNWNDGVTKSIDTPDIQVEVGDSLSFQDGVTKELYGITKHWNDEVLVDLRVAGDKTANPVDSLTRLLTVSTVVTGIQCELQTTGTLTSLISGDYVLDLQDIGGGYKRLVLYTLSATPISFSGAFATCDANITDIRNVTLSDYYGTEVQGVVYAGFGDSVSVVLGEITLDRTVGDDLNNWQDEAQVFLALNVTVGDDLNNWDDEVQGFEDLNATVGDTSNSWLDELAASFQLNARVGDSLALTDGVQALKTLSSIVGDSVTTWQDAVKTLEGLNAVLGDNSNNWSDSVDKDLQTLILALTATLSDSLSFSDGVQAFRTISAIIGDSSNNWQDAVEKFMTGSALSAELGDSINNWQDNVQGFMDLRVTIGDSLSFSDSVRARLTGGALAGGAAPTGLKGKGGIFTNTSIGF